MDPSEKRLVVYLELIQSKSTLYELNRSELYQELFRKAVELVKKGYNPFHVAVALARLTSILLEALDDCSSERTD